MTHPLKNRRRGYGSSPIVLASRPRPRRTPIHPGMNDPITYPRFAYWQDGNGPMFGYTTQRVENGFESFVMEPTGPGSRSGKAQRWELGKVRTWQLRREAKADALRAFRHWREHGVVPWT